MLTRGGEPMVIKGVGGHSDLETLASIGGNSLRTWDAEGIRPLMDRAHALGLSVAVGIWLEHERHGFNYDDSQQRRAQLARVERLVRELRDHPALLLWGAGNEVEIGVEHDPEAMDRAFRSIEDAAALIQSLDPDHPVMTVISEIGRDGSKARSVVERCPSVDVLGVNSYGGAPTVGARLAEAGVTVPFIITEGGPIGHWESESTPWGAAYEPSSGDKAAFFRRSIGNNTPTRPQASQSLGAFAFLWGHKQEATATWYGMFLPTGERLESVDVLHEIWTGQEPAQHAPHVEGIGFGADHRSVEPGEQFTVHVNASDADGDALHIEWTVSEDILERGVGGDREPVPETVEGVIRDQEGLAATMTAPRTPGPYRLFVTVRDGTGRAGTANLPFLVIGPR